MEVAHQSDAQLMPRSEEELDGNSTQEQSPGSDSSDSDEDSDRDSSKDLQIEQLEAAVRANPTKYEAHVEYINVLRRSGHLEKLRSAREEMNALFPLSPTMWREWTHDEARLISSADDIFAVEALYERGVQEYLSVPLWLDFLEFKEKHDTVVTQHTAEGISMMRALYERALTAAGLHLAEGSKIWKAYRHFEQMMLANMGDTTPEVEVKQIECIRSLFRRQLSVPLSDFAETLSDYKEWESQQGSQIGDETNELAGIPANISSAHKKAVKLCTERQAFEDKLVRGGLADAELLQNFLAYIALEEATGDPARAQVLYERAVAEFPVTDELWRKYTQYLEMNLKVSSVIRPVYTRAVRNCPWVQGLWSGCLLALERSNASEFDISAVFEQSMQSGFGFSTPHEYLEHFLTRIDGLRRRISSLSDENEEKQSCFLTIRETFDRALRYLSSFFPEFIDRSLRLFSYWAYIEAKLANDIAAARGVWENLVKSSGWMPEAWQGYISMEIMLDNLKDARAIYKRCYSRRLEGNGTEVMCEAWLRFEREHGSLEDYDRALMKVKPRLAEVRLLQQQQAAKPVHSSAASLVDKQANSSQASLTKRKSEHVKSLSTTRANKKAKTIGEETMLEAKQENSQSEPKELMPKKQTVYTDQCTVFVSNIPLEATKENIRNFFSSCGGLKEIRLLKNRFTGQSRGLAYIDFEDERGLAAAVAKNKEKMQGRRLSIARSDPASSRSGGSGSGATGHGFTQRNSLAEGTTSKGRVVDGQGPTTIVHHRRGGHVQLTGRNTFAVPRTVVRPLGFAATKNETTEAEEVPKSNDEFRKMLLKKSE